MKTNDRDWRRCDGRCDGCDGGGQARIREVNFGFDMKSLLHLFFYSSFIQKASELVVFLLESFSDSSISMRSDTMDASSSSHKPETTPPLQDHYQIPSSFFLLPLGSAGVGMIIGLRRGGRTAQLRFLAENAHRQPRTKQGWVGSSVITRHPQLGLPPHSQSGLPIHCTSHQI